MRCPNCGRDNWEWVPTCTNCGEALPGSEARAIEHARTAAERGDWDPAVELLREELAAAGSAAPAALRTSLATTLASRGVAAAESALGRVQLRPPEEDEMKDELARRARMVLSASVGELGEIVQRYPTTPSFPTPPTAPWWRRRPKITVRRVLLTALVVMVLLILLATGLAGIAVAVLLAVLFAVSALIWITDDVIAPAFRWLGNWWRSLAFHRLSVGPTRDYQMPEIRCDASGCTSSATTQVDLEQQTGDRELRSKYLCAVHTAVLERVLRAPVVAGARADRSAIALLRAAETDLQEAAVLDPSLRGVEENLSQVKMALVRVGERPGPRPTAQAPTTPRVREAPRVDTRPQVPRAAPRRVKKKRRRR